MEGMVYSMYKIEAFIISFTSAILYNPFSPYTKSTLKEQISEGNRWFVLQRFKWPLVADGKGFMVTAYQNEEDALWHASQLDEKEGKALHMPDDLHKLEALLQTGSGYRLYLDKIKEENWNKRMLKVYEKPIINFLRARTRFTRKDTIDILFTLELGRVKAKITNGTTEINVNAIDLIK